MRLIKEYSFTWYSTVLAGASLYHHSTRAIKKKCMEEQNADMIMMRKPPSESIGRDTLKLANKTAKQVKSVSSCADKSVVSKRVAYEVSLLQIVQKTAKYKMCSICTLPALVMANPTRVKPVTITKFKNMSLREIASRGRAR
mmetsp:Transcript_9645/g.24030  ORF Transcript_9645/g.24030 Transcript_9645/m.24030 type:complete len:142 (+) Transcript_9645:1973-2398(+)